MVDKYKNVCSNWLTKIIDVCKVPSLANVTAFSKLSRNVIKLTIKNNL